MMKRIACVLMLATTAYGSAAPGENRPARPDAVTIRWSAGGAGLPPGVEVAGLSRTDLDAFSVLQKEPERISGQFRVSVFPPGRNAPAIAGKYRILGDVLRFEPRFPFEPGVRYQARFVVKNLPIDPPHGAPDITSEYTWPERKRGEPAMVARVDPTSDRLPENLLKFYLHFSKPMSRGRAYGHVRILDAHGHALRSPFLEIGEELWDPSGTRLTLLLDPGRIKRGLRPREEEGPILEDGKAYTLVVDRAWPDAEGQPLRDGFRKVFRAGPADATQPDPKTWTVAPPDAGSSEPLIVTFPEPLDRAILDRAIALRDADGRILAGRSEVNTAATRWQFQPMHAWAAGTYTLVIDAELEDLAGNSIARPFELDVFNRIADRQETPTATLPFVIRAKP